MSMRARAANYGGATRGLKAPLRDQVDGKRLFRWAFGAYRLDRATLEFDEGTE
jgi:hypothetical protein